MPLPSSTTSSTPSTTPRATTRVTAPADPVPVATILTPAERSAVDAAGHGLYRTIHRTSLDEVRRDLREQSANVVLLSLACCSPRDAIRMASILREHPRTPVMGLVTSAERVHPQSLLSLGRSGMRIVIDARESKGWHLLRETVATVDRSAFTMESVMIDLRVQLAAAGDDLLELFELMFTAHPPIHTVRQLATQVHVHPGTLMSRFQRAGLQSLKRYLDLANLVRAAHRLEDPARSIADVSTSLDYSSPQSFGRHVQLVLGLTASAFRERYDCEGMYRRFREDMVTPVHAQLVKLRPLRPFGVEEP